MFEHDDDMKRTQTLSVRCTAELEAQLQAIALAHDVSLSTLINEALEQLAARERRRYEQLRRAFGANEDLPSERG